MRMKQTQRLIEAKEYKIRQMEENNLSQELMKTDKWQELSNLMHKSISKVKDLKRKNKDDHRLFRRDRKQVISECHKKVKH